MTWVPDGAKLDWKWDKGRLVVIIPKLGIHGVLIVQ